MAQLIEEEHFQRLSIEETFDESARSLISIPKNQKNSYKLSSGKNFTCWLPLDSANMEPEFPIVVQNPMLTSFIFMMKSEKCWNCSKLLLPRPSKNMSLPEFCPKCKKSRKQVMKTPIKKEPSISKALVRLDQLLADSVKRYDLFANFQEKTDYTDNYHHQINHEIYLKETIIKDATEIKIHIDSLIIFDGFPLNLFTKGKRTYISIFTEIIDNEPLMKLEPFLTLISMTSSIIKPHANEIKPLIRGSRTSPATVTNSTQLQK